MSLSKGSVSVASYAVCGSLMLHVWRVSPMTGTFLVIIPSCAQFSWLRKSLSESLVTRFVGFQGFF